MVPASSVVVGAGATEVVVVVSPEGSVVVVVVVPTGVVTDVVVVPSGNVVVVVVPSGDVVVVPGAVVWPPVPLVACRPESFGVWAWATPMVWALKLATTGAANPATAILRRKRRRDSSFGPWVTVAP